MTSLARSERAQLADLLDAVGPQAPTLCEGWTTADLAAHLVVRESDPLAVPGMFWTPLAPLTQRRMQRQLHEGNWTDLVNRVRTGRRRLSISAIPGLDAVMNGMEFFIHHEDVRRAGESPAEPRNLLVEHEAQLWRRASLLARVALRHTSVGVVIENALDEEAPLRLRPGARTVTLVGKPSELLLHLSGRRGHAQVEVIGEPDDIAALSGHL